MSYCYDFIKKFKKEGNFCGLDKSEVSRLEAYIEIMKTLETHDLDEKFIVEMFPLGAARVIIPLKDERRTQGLCYVKEQLLAKKHVTAKALSEKLEISNNKPQSKPKTKKEPQKEEIKKPQSGPVSGLGTVPKSHPNHGVGCAQPGSLPAETDTPPIEPLSKVMDPAPTTNEKLISAKLVVAPSGKSPFKTASQVKDGIAGEMFPGPDPGIKENLTPALPCREGKPCPDLQNPPRDFLIKQQILGNKCKLTGSLTCDMKECPLLRREAEAKAGGFVTGNGTPSQQGKPITNERGPLNIIPVQLTKEQAEAAITSVVRRYFTPKSQEQWTQLKKVGGWDTDLEALEGLRDDAAERME